MQKRLKSVGPGKERREWRESLLMWKLSFKAETNQVLPIENWIRVRSCKLRKAT